MNRHTAGTIRIKQGRTLVADGDNYPLFDRLRQTNGEAVARANMERARDCWNALAGLSTEQVQRLGRWLEPYNADEIDQMLRESGV